MGGYKTWEDWNAVGHHPTGSSLTSSSSTHSMGSKSGGFHVGGCGHLGKIEVWRHQGRAFYGAGSSIKVGDTTRAVLDLAGTASNELLKFKGERPPTPPSKLDPMEQVRFIIQPTPGEVVDKMRGHLAQLAEQASLDYQADIKHYTEVVLPQWQATQTTRTAPLHIRLDWADMSAPKVGLTFWRGLWMVLPEGTDTEPAIIQVCCVGGHGRTGTCLASLMIANGGYSWKNAINHVRYYHCTSAIETDGQVDYLRALSVAAGTSAIPTDNELADKLDGVTAVKASQKPVVKANGKAKPEAKPEPPPKQQAQPEALVTVGIPLPTVAQADFFKTALENTTRPPKQVLVSDAQGRLVWVDFAVFKAQGKPNHVVRGVNFGDSV